MAEALPKLTRGAKGQYWTVNPESGELFASDRENAIRQIAAGYSPATPDQVNAAERELSMREEFKGFAGGAEATALGAIREGVPMVGDDILEGLGYSEEEQRAAIAERPILSKVGGAAGVIGSTIAGGYALKAAGAAASAGKFGQSIERLAQAARASRGARAAATIGEGAIMGAAGAAGASETLRIESGVAESDRDWDQLKNDVIVSSVFGSVLSMVGLMGSSAVGAVARKAGISRAAKTSDDFVSAMNKELAGVDDVALRSEMREGYLSFRQNLRQMSDEDLASIAERASARGKPVDATADTVIAAAAIDDVSAAAVAAEVSMREAQRRIGDLAGRIGAAAAAGAVHPMFGFGLVIAGRGAGGILGAAARGAGRGLARPVLGDAIGSVGRAAVSPLVSAAASAAARKGAAHIARSMRLGSIAAASRYSISAIDESNFRAFRDAIDYAPDAESRMATLLDSGVDQDTAAAVVSNQTVMLGMLDKAIPKTSNPSPPELARANRYLDSIMRPDKVLKRMADLDLTAEDAEVIARQDPDAIAWVQQLVETARSDGGAARFTPKQRAQQDLLLGQAMGVSGAAIQAEYERMRNMKPKRGHVLNVSKQHGTRMQTLEA